MTDDKVEYPRWMYGPSGEAQIFESVDDVPEGWRAFQGELKKDEEVAIEPEITSEAASTTTDVHEVEVSPEPEVSQEPAVLSAELSVDRPSNKGKRNGRKGSNSIS